VDTNLEGELGQYPIDTNLEVGFVEFARKLKSDLKIID